MKLSSDPAVQRFAQSNRLKTKIDADGTPIIPGKLGHIYQYDENRLGVMVMPNNSRVRYWNITRRRLANLGFSIAADSRSFPNMCLCRTTIHIRKSGVMKTRAGIVATSCPRN